MTKILLIEDSPTVREFIVDTLTFEGFEIIVAENGLVGLQLAQEHRPDLILCDIMMPGDLDGYAVLAGLHKDARTATIPFIFTSAKTERADLRRGMDLGADDYLPKPFSMSELLSAVRTRLERHLAHAKRSDKQLDTVREPSSVVALDEQRALPTSMKPITLLIGDQQLTLPTTANFVVGRLGDVSDYSQQPDVDLSQFAADEKGVSRRHIRIRRQGDLTYVSDLGSKNGTWLNDKQLLIDTERVLRSGDELRLGNLRLLVRF